METLRARFASLHESGVFVMPNAWDVGSARILESLGFEALATTSSGFAASLGRHDQSVSLDELVDHVAAITAAVGVPVSVDSEAGYADDIADLDQTVVRLASAGAAGVSIEDYLPARGLLDVSEATERVARFGSAARTEGVVVTARAENYLYGVEDIEDTIIRLRAYADVGADVVYAPGLVDLEDIERIVAEVECPVNVLLAPGGPDVTTLGDVGVRRVSTGGALTFAAYGALAVAGRELFEAGTSEFTSDALSREEREAAFGD